ncbi:MAG: diguanylate cyclase [Desulfobacteraceae bacterium]|nr:MAG: diguanylate cyclase [Desulfobacteraceae bacterium]
MKNQGRGKLLLVDDIKANVNILQLNLKTDYHIDVAFDGESALEQVAKNPPDLILLDIQMPGIDGYEVCRRLKNNKNTEKIPIVFITSKNEEEDETKGLELGAIDYIIKPFSMPIVKARVKNLMQMKKQQDILENLSLIDGLTGIPNRRYFDLMLHHEWQRAMRTETALALIMIDIDFFKTYNDYYGHVSGDECLKSVAQALTASINRSMDFIARYGGEEFAVILPGTSIEGALTLGENMRQNVMNLGIAHKQSLAADFITISLGVANIIPKKEYGQRLLIEGADKALYEAKRNSRNICRRCSTEDMMDLQNICK